jgi:hypothetical protein
MDSHYQVSSCSGEILCQELPGKKKFVCFYWPSLIMQTPSKKKKETKSKPGCNLFQDIGNAKDLFSIMAL